MIFFLRLSSILFVEGVPFWIVPPKAAHFEVNKNREKAKIWPIFPDCSLHTAHMSVFMFFCGPHLPLPFFWLRPGGKVSLFLVAPPQSKTGYSSNRSFCWRTTFRNNCAVRKLFRQGFRGSESSESLGSGPARFTFQLDLYADLARRR